MGGINCRAQSGQIDLKLDAFAQTIESEYNGPGLFSMVFSKGQIIAKRYKLTKRIGSGGYGTVWEAYDKFLGRVVALKQLKNTERLNREVAALAALSHPCVCTLFDKGTDYFVMEYVRGEELRGPLGNKEGTRTALQIAEALEAIHQKKILHRDLTPSNIVKTSCGIKLLDFGLATAAPVSPSAPTASVATPDGTPVGTWSYMSPEQLQGRQADVRSEIFTFGLVLYELLTGKKAFACDRGTVMANLERWHHRFLWPAGTSQDRKPVFGKRAAEAFSNDRRCKRGLGDISINNRASNLKGV